MADREIINPWHMPTKVKGETLIAVRDWRDQARQYLLVKMAKEETARLKVAKAEGRYNGNTTISVNTLLVNFAFYPTTFTRIKSAELNKEYKQLKRQEKTHGKQYLDGIKG